MRDSPDGLVVIRTYQVEHEAELARVVLETNGIPAVILRDNAGGMLPVLQLYFPLRVAVPEDDVERALALLDVEGDWPPEHDPAA